MTEQVNQRNKDIKAWADGRVPCSACKGGDIKEYLQDYWCPSCGVLYEDIPTVLYEGDPIRVYDKRHAVIRDRMVTVASGIDAIRILKISRGKRLSEAQNLRKECIDFFARPIKLSDDNQGEKEGAT